MRLQPNHLARQHGDVITQMISKYGPLPVKQVIKGQLSLKVDSYAMICVHLAGGNV